MTEVPARVQRDAASAFGGTAAIYGAVLAIALVPLLAASVPPLSDYPNHLARMHLLAELDRSEALASIYTVQWKVLPNLAMDLIVPLLTPLLGLEIAGKLFLAASLVLLVLGTAAVHRALYGRAGLWPLAMAPFLASTVLAYGFLNYLFGVGLMLCAFAAWLATERGPALTHLALGAVFSLLLFFAHFGAFGAYGLCVLACLVAREGRLLSPAGVKALLLEALPVAPPLLLLLAASPTLHGDLSLLYVGWDKLRGLLTPVIFLDPPRDLLLFGPLLALLAAALLAGRLALHRRLRAPLIGLGLAYLLVPTWLMDNWGNDLRIALPAFALLVAASRPRADHRRTAVVLAAACLAGLSLRSATVTADWARYDALYDEFRAASRLLPEGARLLPAIDRETPPEPIAPSAKLAPFYNLAALAVLERALFLPSLFTADDRQILAVREPFRSLDVPHLKPLPLPILRRAAAPASAAALSELTVSAKYFHRFAGWPEHFDAVVVFDFGRHDNPLPGRLSVLRRGSFFTLYDVGPADS